MSNNPEIFTPLLKSIDALIGVDKSIQNDQTVLSSYSDYLSKNESSICKFAMSSKELMTYLDQYDFKKGFRFDIMQGRLEKLDPLWQKMLTMGEEAKKLSACPDRYDLKKTLGECRELVLTCVERMNLRETEKMSEMIDASTKKLRDLQKLFENDGHTLDQIKAAIDKEKGVLSKYKAYYAELQEYVKMYPHKGQDDLLVVQDRIGVVKGLDKIREDVEVAVESIRNCCDRYNKKAIVANYTDLIGEMTSSMRFVDIERIKTQLNNLLKLAGVVADAFASEINELAALQSALRMRTPDLWKEDGERLLATVNSLLDRDTRKAVFNMDQLKADYSNAKLRRAKDVGNTTRQYPWLETEPRYRKTYSELVSRYVTSSEYRNAVDGLRFRRILRIVLWFVPVIGWIINLKTDLT